MIWMGFYEITLILNENRVILSQVGFLAVKSIRKIAWVHSQNIVSTADSVREP